MKFTVEEIKEIIKKSGLKATPQRIAILDAVYTLNNHPTAENILEHIQTNHPSIASGTVYHVLDVLIKNNLIKRVKTEKDVMRYDGVMELHHHLYCSECDIIEDYKDDELDKLLKNYFEKKDLPGFNIEDVVLQIRGKFKKC